MAQPSAQESELQLLPPVFSEAEMVPSEADERSIQDGMEREIISGRTSISTSSSTQVYVDRWPVEPQKLRRNAQSDTFTTFLEIILALLPGVFLALAITVIRLDGDEISDNGAKVIQAINLTPSIFPIVFAAIVGSMMRSLALWRAERCASLGTLEQLNGSTSFAGTFSLVLALRRPSILTLCILLLWTMSPLGGQSALRMISETPSSVSSDIALAFMNMSKAPGLSGASGFYTIKTPMRSIYTTSLIASKEAKASRRDVWGWPKIPLLRTLLPSDGALESGTNPWRAVPSDSTLTSYSSLLGLVLQGVPPHGNVEFPVESSYFDLDCYFIANNLTWTEVLERMGSPLLLYHNASRLFGDGTNYSNFFVDTSFNLTTLANTQSQINLFYVSQEYPPGGYAGLFNCTISTVPVESWVICQSADCAVSRMRQSTKDTRPASSTPFSSPEYPGYLGPVPLEILIGEFPQAASEVNTYQSSPTDSYIYGDTVLLNTEYERNWSTMDPQILSTRLTTVFNTCWQSAIAPFTFTSAVPSNPVNLTPAGSGDFIPDFNATSGTASHGVTVYCTNTAWVTVFIISTALLQLCALTGIFLRSTTRAPDILGYVSSLTRTNPYVPLPKGGSALSGLERARLLQNIQIQIADVECSKDVGYLAVVSPGAVGGAGDTGSGAGAGTQRLRRGRRYA
ncbi:uncharacterized protein DSM5745_08602 [Aspergillus mulundensis]|uniref:Uncharacterized protein n=1 Tax=Aspergillus mulundensis TaxID=1810919 RepID=A0A3D8R456_9EURO|nr:hypothetical protein DSM5745_08602 [Aspergillus mulundensis]RDW68842.1 hypothetical protein DSM5745_08602 [Aspergillus mulundensis]